jgi:hypothetical protein
MTFIVGLGAILGVFLLNPSGNQKDGQPNE